MGRYHVRMRSSGACVVALVLAFALAATARAQAPTPAPPAIQDNSFLIEEAYNQEAGVVQHINSLNRSWDSGDWYYSFTQEWPLGGVRHQISWTLPVQRLTLPDQVATGLGDVALNYRLQIVGSGDTRLAIAPRLSVFFPTGSDEHGLGAGGVALQANVPMSVVFGKHLVTHWNAGLTWAPSAKDRSGNAAATTAINLGQSVVWLAHPRLNLLVETVWLRAQSVSASGVTTWSEAFYVSPGFRWAYNFTSGLQIVPGIAIPIGLGPSRGDTRLILYLSFEHPFRRARG